MPTNFFSKLSQNYIELLEDDEYYDITIEVGEDPNDNVLTHIKLSNISPEIFQTILKYIYGGVLSLSGQDALDILKLLLAAEELNIRNTSYAVRYYYQFGPYFGYDIIISASRESVNYGDIWCRKRYYEKKIRDTEEQFSMEDYEVHQITRE
ncbi:BTB/POZ protein [Rhizophagus irregularis DAOM 181602=DAOM 197198]|nr:BTB/POZ protein [Rhizophagus irregularis DAOM 181602=DAOM 197198]